MNMNLNLKLNMNMNMILNMTMNLNLNMILNMNMNLKMNMNMILNMKHLILPCFEMFPQKILQKPNYNIVVVLLQILE